MIKVYFKQAWMLMRQNKLFSIIYIAGTGLAIATTMIMAIVYYVKIAPVYPEKNRNRTFYMETVRFDHKERQQTIQYGVSWQALKELYYPLRHAAVVSAEVMSGWGGIENYVQPTDGSGEIGVVKKMTDTAFFRIYDFRFIEGKPFSEADFRSGVHVAVISDDLARRLFGTLQEVVGQEFSLDYVRYRVCGVVACASLLTPKSFAQVYVPYTTENGYDTFANGIPYCGSFQLTFLLDSSSQEKLLREELDEVVRRFNTDGRNEWIMKLSGQPRSHLLRAFQGQYPEPGFTWMNLVRRYLLVLLVLLLVPALNLGGMISSRMEMRLAEMGIRKSFGASRRVLINQVVCENLLLTLLGGLLGLLLAWTTLIGFRNWVFALFEHTPSVPIEGVSVEVSGEMLLAPSVFAAALLLCMLLNLLSALLPAWYSLREPIVKSLNEKR